MKADVSTCGSSEVILESSSSSAYERQEILSYSHDLTDEIDVVDYHTIQVKNPADITPLFAFLPKCPLKWFLRRVDGNSKRILVAPASTDIGPIKDKIDEKFGDSVEYHIQPVPNHNPVLRVQYERVKLLWPIKFLYREDLENIFKRKVLSPTELEDYVPIFDKVNGGLKCVVFDDNAKRIVAESEFNPNVACGHASMIVSDLIAEDCRNHTARYHANGCTAILSQEPCVMCAMALNHLRMKRVLFFKANSSRGAFTRSRNILKTWDSHHRYEMKIVTKTVVVDSDEYNPFLEVLEPFRHTNVALIMKKSIATALAVESCWKNNVAFTFIPPKPLNYCWSQIMEFHISLIISDDKLDNKEVTSTLEVLNQTFFLYENQSNNSDIYSNLQMPEDFDDFIAYGVSTSGTTGVSKKVFVPSRTILCNVIPLSTLLPVKPVVAWVTGLYFDPTIVELLLAIVTNGTLLIPSFEVEQVNFDTDSYPDVDFFQITPTNLMIANPLKLEFIKRKVRHLFIGGEAFPSEFVNHNFRDCPLLKVYNIYGITEISCWATLNGPLDFPIPKLVDVGQTFHGYSWTLINDEIFINGPSTFIDHQFRDSFVATGDIGFIQNEKLYVAERKKPGGVNVCKDAEILVGNMNLPEVLSLKTCTVYDNLTLLIAVKNDVDFTTFEAKIASFLKGQLPNHKLPALIFVVQCQNLKTTKNGKIDVESTISGRGTIKLLDNFMISKFGDQNVDRNQTLVASGFDSLGICQLSQFLSQIKGSTFPNYLDLKRFLLEPNTTLDTVYSIVGANTGEFSCPIETADCVFHNYQLDVVCSTSMCVEAPLLALGNKLFFGDMDGQFNVYSVVDPAINISLKTEGSFLESAIVLNVKVFAVTNYGNFVVYDLEKAAFEKTKNPISFGVYGPLTVHNNNRLLFGDERKNLNVVDDNLENLRTLYIGTLFRSKPLIHDDRLFIGGLTEFVIVDVVEMVLLHSFTISTPIFRSLFLHKDRVVSLEASGLVVTYNKNGEQNVGGIVPNSRFEPFVFTLPSTGQIHWIFAGHQAFYFFEIEDQHGRLKPRPVKKIVLPNNFEWLQNFCFADNVVFIIDTKGNLLCCDLGKLKMLKICCDVSLFKHEPTESFSGSVLVQNLPQIYFGTRSDSVQCWTVNNTNI
uniref:CMP/dCMP-type deaminase domain-containing protein n=1 Tax=Panagrolaimus sp. JU765 TaxID=591449 RepID=A0AC34QH55_9BILA